MIATGPGGIFVDFWGLARNLQKGWDCTVCLSDCLKLKEGGGNVTGIRDRQTTGSSDGKMLQSLGFYR